MNGPIILTYHSINDRNHLGIYPDNIVTIDNFEKQLAYLSCNRRILSLAELVRCLQSDGELPSDGVVLTFDDGYSDFYVKAYPILRKYDAPCTVFLVTDLLDRCRPKWDDEVADLINHTSLPVFDIPVKGEMRTYDLCSPEGRHRCILELVKTIHTLSEEQKEKMTSEIRYRLDLVNYDRRQRVTLTWKEAAELSVDADDLISFGAHSHSHPNLVGIPLEMAEQEITLSKRRIESRLSKPCVFFSYPFGAFNEKIKELLRAHDFSAATTAVRGSVSRHSDLLELRRVLVMDDASDAFKHRLEGSD